MDIMKKYKQKFNIFKVLLNKQDPVILEIGAHFGEDSMRFAASFPKADIHCFEPDPRCISVFKKYVNDERIKLHEIALSNVTGELEFYQSFNESETKTPSKYNWISDEDYEKLKLGNSGASSLKKGYNKILPNAIRVKSQRYDDWAEQNHIKEIDLAWIDVQGAEKDVIDGMGNKIHDIRFIWIEYGEMFYDDSMSREQTINLLSSKNFDVIETFSDSSSNGDLLFRRKKND